MKAQKGSRGIAVLMINLGARLGWFVKATPRSIHPLERVTAHILQGAERAVVSIWMDVEERQSLTNLGFVSPCIIIHSFSSLSYDRSKASSKSSSPHSAIQSFLFQMRVSCPFLKLIQ